MRKILDTTSGERYNLIEYMVSYADSVDKGKGRVRSDGQVPRKRNDKTKSIQDEITNNLITVQGMRFVQRQAPTVLVRLKENAGDRTPVPPAGIRTDCTLKVK